MLPGMGDALGSTEVPAQGGTTTLLRFDQTVPEAPAPDTTIVVLDTTWTPSSADRLSGRCESLRDVAARVLTSRNLLAECANLLDTWAEESGVVEELEIEGVSFWYSERLHYLSWLVDHVLWLAVVEDLVASERPAAIECCTGTDAGLVTAARAIAERDGIAFRPPPEAGPQPTLAVPRSASPGGKRPLAGARGGKGLLARVREYWSLERRKQRLVVRRIGRIQREQQRPLLVVQAHRRQRIDTADGPRFLNPYLGPVKERLVGTKLNPVEIDIRGSLDDVETWDRIGGQDGTREFPVEALTLAGPAVSRRRARERATTVSRAVGKGQTPLHVAGIDLGPDLTRKVAARTKRVFARSLIDVARIRQLLRQIRPPALLIADEYHRQDWLAAAGAENVRTAAIQHGVIYRWHNGYMHRTRPASLRLPDRTYVFGEWERDLLTTQSVYRGDEVRVGGSPRLDLVQPEAVDSEAIRRELGIADGDRMVVISGTWGPLHRRFHYPIALAFLFCRPIERVHLVVKLHPTEADEGPYRKVIEGLASAGGFEPPPITIVQSIDLYRLLAAADAHLGIYSTVLTEAAATGTVNLLADVLASSDLLGYVEAGVAVPVRSPEDIAAALDNSGDGGRGSARRLAFLRAHYEPGLATERIAGDLLAWLA